MKFADIAPPHLLAHRIVVDFVCAQCHFAFSRVCVCVLCVSRKTRKVKDAGRLWNKEEPNMSILFLCYYMSPLANNLSNMLSATTSSVIA